MAVCERLDEPKVATPDRRDFSAVRPRQVEAPRPLPDGTTAALDQANSSGAGP